MDTSQPQAPVHPLLRHTSPGPWGWEEGTPTIFREWNGRKVCIAQVKAADLDWHEDMRMASIESGANAKLIAATTTLASEHAKMRAALDFYANPEVYKPHPHGLAFDRRDLSFHAREVLASLTT